MSVDKTRVTELTDAHRSAMPGYAARWVEWGLSCEPADRRTVEGGIRRCYESAGIEWHGNVVWCEDPLTVAFAGPTAAQTINNIGGAVEGAVSVAVGRAVGGAVDGAVNGAVSVVVDGVVGRVVDGAVEGAVSGVVDGAVSGAVGRAVEGVVGRVVDGAVEGAVSGVVDGAVEGAVGRAVEGAVDGVVDGAVGRAVYGAVNRAVEGVVDGVVDGAVNVAVGRAVGRAVEGVVDWWSRYVGGRFWASWIAWRAFFRDVPRLDIPEWELMDAWIDANSAGWWWPHEQFVIVADTPEFIHREQIRPDGWGSHQLHNDNGPAIGWRSGLGFWFWHGLNVPQWVVEAPTIEQISTEDNVEIRRAAIESYGWDRMLTHLDLVHDSGDELVGSLFDVPERLWGDPVRMLLVRNGSPHADGTFARYGLTVPKEVETADQAQAWMAGLETDEWASLARRT